MFIIYTLKGCPYCNLVLTLMKENKFSYKNIIVKDKEKNNIKKKHKYDTFPQVFYKYKDTTKFLGGYEKTNAIITINNFMKKNNMDCDFLQKMCKLFSSYDDEQIEKIIKIIFIIQSNNLNYNEIKNVYSMIQSESINLK